jgi:transposase InsO family protein
MTHLREKYWIPAMRQNVKSILRKCTTCRRVSGMPFLAPEPPPLPKVRVDESPPFTVTGVDYTGALYVRQSKENQSNKPVTKVYICLFTCAVTRAIHLEVVQDLSEDSFLQAFRRFVSRKSLPKVLISDNSTTFQAASNHLKRLFGSTSVTDTFSRRGVEWRFIPKRAPWYGGFWERLIGLTKTSLKKVLGRSSVTLETLQTIVTEIEAILNDRPITYVSSELNDPEPLTPAHLLYGRKMTSLIQNDVVFEDIDLSRSALLKRDKVVTHTISQFWNRWRTEYLLALREQHRSAGSNNQRIRVGDVVLIHDDGPRIRWKLAVVEHLIHGNDGLCRAATVRTTSGVTSRPIVKLYPLEVNETDSL